MADHCCGPGAFENGSFPGCPYRSIANSERPCVLGRLHHELEVLRGQLQQTGAERDALKRHPNGFHLSALAWPGTREAVAAWLHDVAWSGWWKYMRGVAVSHAGAPSYETSEEGVDARLIMGKHVSRWDRQAGTPYTNLPESEKASDRELADKLIALLTGKADG